MVDHNPRPYQRRIGERHPIRVPLTWGPVPRSRWGRKRQWTVTTDNVSLSGVGFVSEARPEITQGQAVRIVMGGITSGALVKVVRPDETSDRTYYGLEFHGERMLESAKELIADFERADIPDAEGTSG